MAEIYVPPGRDPLEFYREYKKTRWIQRTPRGTLLKWGFAVGVAFAIVLFLVVRVIPNLNFNFGIGLG